jgi:serine/threonine protein kinase
MGRVYSATDLLSGERVALKCLSLDTQDALVRFEREAQSLRGVQHPNIVRYVDHGRDGAVTWLAMEYVAGEPLRARMARTGLAVDEALSVARQVASALGALHQRDMVHRDVKPSNIMVPLEGLSPVKLVDFGLVKGSLLTASVTSTGVAVGSPGYMAPEQVLAQPLSPASDVYALGCVLYFMVTGYKAFPGDTPAAVCVRILTAQPPLAHAVNPHCPEALGRLIARMMAREPGDRPPDAMALLQELDGIAVPADAPPTRVAGVPPPLHTQTVTSIPSVTPMRREEALSYAIALAPPIDGETTPEQLAAAKQLVDKLCQQYGGTSAELPDGAQLLLPPPGPAQLVEAAACSLRLSQGVPDRRVALVLVSEAERDRAIDGALQLLMAEDMLSLTGMSTIAGVRVDAATAQRLSRQYDLAAENGRTYLVATR